MLKRPLVSLLVALSLLLPTHGKGQGARISGAAKITGAGKVGKGGTGPTPSVLSLWNASTTVPTTADVSTDNSSLDLGVGWFADTGGYVTGFRFYKGANNTGTHVGELWTGTGVKLTSATYTAETSSGWQQQTLTTQYPVCPSTRYVVSYTDPNGNYALDRPYFTSQHDAAPLHAYADGANGLGNGVYFYPSSGFPNSSYQSSNYWVDLLYATDATAIGVTDVSPRTGTGGDISNNIGATQVTVSGCNFDSSASVTVGGVSVTNLSIDATVLIFNAPQHANGVVDIVITDGAQTITIPAAFTYVNASTAPTITSLTPNTGITTGNQTVTITGTRFDNTASVSFGGLAATNVAVLSATQLTCVAPAHAAGTIAVIVTGAGGASASFNFTYANVIFSDNFDSGNFSNWTAVSSNGSNTVSVCGTKFNSSPDSACQTYSLAASAGGADRESGIFIEKDFSGLTHFNTRGYFYFGTPAWTGSSGLVQRRLFKLLDQSTLPNFSCVLNTIDYQLALQCGGALGDPASTTYLGSFISTGSWHSVEMEVQLNTAGNHDGLARVWLDGNLSISKVVDVRGDMGQPEGTQLFKVFYYGQDIETSATGAITESRYLDDVVVAGTYVGPTAPPVTVTGVSPSSGPAAGGTSITVSGTGFASGATVSVGPGNCGSVSVSTSISLTCSTPPGTAGTLVPVTVTTTGGTGSLNNAFGYQSVAPSSGAQLTGCFVTALNAASCPGGLPAGYTNISAVSFEDGTVGNGSMHTGGSETLVVTSSFGHTGTHSLKGQYLSGDSTIGWFSPSISGNYDTLISFWEYDDPTGRLNVDFDIAGVEFPGITNGPSATVRFQVGCGGRGGTTAADIPYYWNALQEQPILYVEGGGSTPNFATWGWGNECLGPNAPSWGNWTQWELHVHYNPPTTLSSPASGAVEIYQNGVLMNKISPNTGQCSSNPQPCSNLAGTMDIATVNRHAQVGGVYTLIIGYLDAALTHCLPVPEPPGATIYPGGGQVTGSFVGQCKSTSSSTPCPNMCPTTGFPPSFFRYFDDIIVLAK